MSSTASLGEESGLQTPLAEAFFEHFFSNRGTFTEPELIQVVEKVGLNVTQATSILVNDLYSEEVKLIEEHFNSKGYTWRAILYF